MKTTERKCITCGSRNWDDTWEYCGEDEHGAMYLCPSCAWDAHHEDAEDGVDAADPSAFQWRS